MSSDRCIYYDFSKEKVLDDLHNTVKEGGLFSYDAVFECEAGNYILLVIEQEVLPEQGYAAITQVEYNDRIFELPGDAIPYFTGKSGNRNGIFLPLEKGFHTIRVRGTGKKENLETLPLLSLIKDFEKTQITPSYSALYDLPANAEKEEKKEEKNFDFASFQPGIGCEEIPGRFGFTKGDGVLDCAMLTLGTLCKMYMLGHPRYQKPFIWHYSTFPHKNNPYFGSRTPARKGLENNDVKINHLTSSWGTVLDGEKFSCTYSLASPGVITEYSGGKMRISDLEYAGNYQYALLCRKGGKAQVVSLRQLSIEDMAENFILLFGTTEFPDLPLLIVFQKKPSSVTVKYHEKTNRLQEILFSSCPLIITSTPFGIESFDPIQPDDRSFIEKSLAVCRFWSRAFLAYPVKCEEYFKNDEEKKKTSIIQKFSFRYIEDDWGTPPLELAPLPPVAQLSGVMTTGENNDFAFPTQFGPLKGWYGNTSSYTIAYMPCERKFPLCEPGRKEELTKLLKEGFDEYLDFVSSFAPPAQSYPYAGAFLEPYAFASALTNFLSREDQARLRENLLRALHFVCDEEATGDYKAIDWAEIMYSNPENKELLAIYDKPTLRRLALHLWNTRKEPFTGREYTVCYLNLGYFSSGMLKKGTREEIKNFAVPVIENDWGLGLTFYYLYLSVLSCGTIAPVKENFEILKKAFFFFEIFHDWACMGSGYSENGVTWCEGANYGAFTAFVQLCELLEDKENYTLARYYSSKQMALRLGIFRASRYYFYKYFGIAPYDICQSFREGNQIFGQFLNAPKDIKEYGYRPHTLYKMTTEGVYGELFEAIRKFFPEDWKRVRSFVGRDLHEMGEAGEETNWGKLEPAAVYLMALALDENVPSDEFENELEAMKKYHYLMQRWRGIHIFSRRLPENAWETQARAWNEMKKHPIWLTLWKNVKILSGEWDGKEATIQLEKNGKDEEKAFVRFGYKKAPAKVFFEGKEVKAVYNERENSLQIQVEKSGVITLKYD